MSNVTEYVSGFPETTELRKTSTANAFVTVSYSYEMEYEVLRSHFSYSYINGLNPAAVGDFSFIDSRNRSPVSFEAYYYEGGFES